jgi:hypothetical protein
VLGPHLMGCSCQPTAAAPVQHFFAASRLCRMISCSDRQGGRICVHMFACTCPDFLSRQLPCKHCLLVLGWIDSTSGFKQQMGNVVDDSREGDYQPLTLLSFTRHSVLLAGKAAPAGDVALLEPPAMSGQLNCCVLLSYCY